MFKNAKINLLLVSLFSVTAYAADLTTDKIEVISVTPLPSLGVSLDKIPSSVQTVKASDLKKSQALDISSYINQNLSGVYINETQNNPLQADVNYRGYTASPLLGTPQGLSVYLDGVRLNQPFGDVVSWDLIPKNAIKSMQLMPGSNPLFGLNTLGGALSIQTKDGRSSPGGAIQASMGSYARKLTEFEYGGVSNDNSIDYFFAGTYFDENGWRDHSNSEAKQFFGKLGWRNEKTDVKLTYAYADTDLNGNGLVPETFLKQRKQTVYTYPDNTKNDSHFLNFQLSHYFQPNVQLSTNAYYRRIRTNSFNGDINDDALGSQVGAKGQTWLTSGSLRTNCTNALNVGAGNNIEPGEKCSGLNNRGNNLQENYGITAQFSVENKIFGKENTYTVGGGLDLSDIRYKFTSEYGWLSSDRVGATIIGSGFYRDEITAGNIDGSIDDASVDLKGKTRTWSVFGTDTISLADNLHLTGSLRYNHTKIKNRDQQIHHNFVAYSDDNNSSNDNFNVDLNSNNLEKSLSGDHVFNRINPAIGLTFTPIKNYNTYVGYNEGMRAPTAVELGCANPDAPCRLPNAMAGDPPLKAVVSKTWEAGIRAKENENLFWSAGVFSGRNTNDIQFISATGTGAGYFQNVGETQRRGLEASLGTKFNNLSLGGNYTFLDATFESDITLPGPANSSGTSNGNPQGYDSYRTIDVKKGDRLANTPRNIFKLYANYQISNNFNVGIDSITISQTYLRGNENGDAQAGSCTTGSTTANTPYSSSCFRGNGKNPGYTVFNLSAAYKPKTDWTIFGRVNNLFDKDYTTGGQLGITPYGTDGAFDMHSSTRTRANGENFLAPGAPRTAWIGVRWEFGGKKSEGADSN
jgi:outer membrane receptor protein involved in Fe transport